MARIRIIDLPRDAKITREEMRSLFGGAEGGGFSPKFLFRDRRSQRKMASLLTGKGDELVIIKEGRTLVFADGNLTQVQAPSSTGRGRPGLLSRLLFRL